MNMSILLQTYSTLLPATHGPWPMLEILLVRSYLLLLLLSLLEEEERGSVTKQVMVRV
jgi:hypothetical protein